MRFIVVAIAALAACTPSPSPDAASPDADVSDSAEMRDDASADAEVVDEQPIECSEPARCGAAGGPRADGIGELRDAVIQQDLIFALNESGLEVIDVRNPSRPRIFLPDDEPVDFPRPGIGVDGSNVVWMSQSGDEGLGPWALHVTDVSDPEEPRTVSVLPLNQIDRPCFNGRLAYGGGTAYAACSNGNERDALHVFDFTDPVRGRAIGGLTDQEWGYAILDVLYRNGIVYLAASVERWFRDVDEFYFQVIAVDVSDPTTPREIQSIRVADWPAWRGRPLIRLAVMDDTLFTFVTTLGGPEPELDATQVVTLDAADLTPRGDFTVEGSGVVQAVGGSDAVYVLFESRGGRSGGIAAVRPQRNGISIDHVGVDARVEIESVGPLALVEQDGRRELRTMDSHRLFTFVSSGDADPWTLESRIDLGRRGTRWSHRVRFYEDLIFVGDGEGGVGIYEICDPLHPTDIARVLEGTWLHGGEVERFAVDDDFLVAEPLWVGAPLHVFDVSDAEMPRLVAIVEARVEGTPIEDQFVLDGTTLYAVGEENRTKYVWSYRLRDAGGSALEPNVRREIPGGDPLALVIGGDWLYALADANGRFVLYAANVRRGELFEPLDVAFAEAPSGIALDGDVLAVAVGNSVHVFDGAASGVLRPWDRSPFEHSRPFLDVALDQGTVYAALDDGVMVLPAWRLIDTDEPAVGLDVEDGMLAVPGGLRPFELVGTDCP